MSKAAAKTETSPMEVDNPSHEGNDDALSSLNEQLQKVQQEIKDVSEQINQAEKQYEESKVDFYAQKVQRLATDKHDLRTKEHDLREKEKGLMAERRILLVPLSVTTHLPAHPSAVLFYALLPACLLLACVFVRSLAGTVLSASIALCMWFVEICSFLCLLGWQVVHAMLTVCIHLGKPSCL